MIGKKNSVRIGAASLATLGTVVIILGTERLWPGLNAVLAVFILAGLWIALYLAGAWTTIDQAELDKQFPPSDKELRRRRKAFFDWQGRR